MVPVLLILVLLSLAVPVIVHALKTALKIPALWRPLLPLVVGLSISLFMFFIPRLGFTLNEAILLGAASAGLGVIIYDFFSGVTTSGAASGQK